ncbi:hypothetical protein Tco_0375200 [Tanacetum coccineum]
MTCSLDRTSSQTNVNYESAASLYEFELTKILIDKMEKNKSYDKADYKKKLYDALVESYNTDKDLFYSYGEVFSLKRTRVESDKDRDRFARSDRGKQRRKSICHVRGSQVIMMKTFCMQQDQEFITGDNDEQPADKEVTKADWFKKPKRPPTPDPDWNHRGRQIIPKDYFINKDLEYLKGEDLSKCYSTSVKKTKAATYELKWIEDLGRIDDADAEVTFIDETLNDARNKNNKISNSKVEDDKETALEVKKCLDTSSW